MKLSAPRTAAFLKPDEECVRQRHLVENEKRWSDRQWVHLVITQKHHLPQPMHFSSPQPHKHTHIRTPPATKPRFSTVFPPHLRVLGWIMQGLYPELKHEWIIWPQGQAVSTFPFTSLFIYLPTRRRTWGGWWRICAWLTTLSTSRWPAFRGFPL